MTAANPIVRVLSIGDDDLLLTVRKMVLEQAGYQAQSLRASAAIGQADVCGYDAIVLCRTVSRDRAESLMHLIRSCNANIPVIRLTAADTHQESSIYSTCDSMSGPTPLLKELDRMAKSVVDRATRGSAEAIRQSPGA